MKLNLKRTVYIGLAFLSISAFWQLYDLLIPLMLENTFELNKTNTGLIMSIDNILALFLLPFLGSLSDKIKTPWGKRTPFIMFGTFFAVIGVLIIPIANNQANFGLFRLGLVIVLLATASYRSPAVALMPDLTPKPLRSKGNAIINLMGALGGVFTLISIKLLVNSNNGNSDYLPVFSAVATIMVISVIILKLKVNENKLLSEVSFYNEDSDDNLVIGKDKKLHPDVLKSLIFILLSIFLWYTAYNAVLTAFSRYAINVWKMKEGGVAMSVMLANIFAILTFIPAGHLSSKIGRKKTILIGVVLVSTAYLAGIFLKNYSLVIYLIFGVMGSGWAMINVNSFPIVVEMSKNSDIGKYTGMYYTASMLAQIITPIFSGFLMDNMGYKILFPYALVFSILSFASMIFVKHGDSKSIIKDKLEVFDLDD